MWKTAKGEPTERDALLPATRPVRQSEMKGTEAVPDPPSASQRSLALLEACVFETGGSGWCRNDDESSTSN